MYQGSMLLSQSANQNEFEELRTSRADDALVGRELLGSANVQKGLMTRALRVFMCQLVFCLAFMTLRSLAAPAGLVAITNSKLFWVGVPLIAALATVSTMAALKAVEVYAHATLLDHPAIWLRNLTSRLIVACVAALASVLTAVCQGFMLREPQFVASSNAASAIQYAFSAAFASVICVMTTSMPVVTSPSLRENRNVQRAPSVAAQIQEDAPAGAWRAAGVMLLWLVGGAELGRFVCVVLYDVSMERIEPLPFAACLCNALLVCGQHTIGMACLEYVLQNPADLVLDLRAVPKLCSAYEQQTSSGRQADLYADLEEQVFGPLVRALGSDQPLLVLSAFGALAQLLKDERMRLVLTAESQRATLCRVLQACRLQLLRFQQYLDELEHYYERCRDYQVLDDAYAAPSMLRGSWRVPGRREVSVACQERAMLMRRLGFDGSSVVWGEWLKTARLVAAAGNWRYLLALLAPKSIMSHAVKVNLVEEVRMLRNRVPACRPEEMELALLALGVLQAVAAECQDGVQFLALQHTGCVPELLSTLTQVSSALGSVLAMNRDQDALTYDRTAGLMPRRTSEDLDLASTLASRTIMLLTAKNYAALRAMPLDTSVRRLLTNYYS